MIREMGNVELLELCETIPKVQWSQCLLYWNQGVIYCTCDTSWLKANQEEGLINFNWMLSLHPALLDQEGATPWCSTRQN